MTTYYTKYKPLQTNGVVLAGLGCCAIAEARMIDSYGKAYSGPPTILQYIKEAIYDKRTWLIFSFVDEYVKKGLHNTSVELEKNVKDLPNCKYLGEEKNPRSGHTIRTYIVNLRKEWPKQSSV